MDIINKVTVLIGLAVKIYIYFFYGANRKLSCFQKNVAQYWTNLT